MSPLKKDKLDPLYLNLLFDTEIDQYQLFSLDEF